MYSDTEPGLEFDLDSIARKQISSVSSSSQFLILAKLNYSSRTTLEMTDWHKVNCVSEAAQNIELAFTPYQLYHTECVTVTIFLSPAFSDFNQICIEMMRVSFYVDRLAHEGSLEMVFLISGSDQKVHMFREVRDDDVSFFFDWLAWGMWRTDLNVSFFFFCESDRTDIITYLQKWKTPQNFFQNFLTFQTSKLSRKFFFAFVSVCTSPEPQNVFRGPSFLLTRWRAQHWNNIRNDLTLSDLRTA